MKTAISQSHPHPLPLPRATGRKIGLVFWEYRWMLLLIAGLLFEGALVIWGMQAAGWPVNDPMVPLGLF